MDQEQRQAILDHWHTLAESMPSNHMTNSLITEGILSPNDLQEINAKETENKKNTTILTKILASVSPDCYAIFIDALRQIPNKNSRLADMIESRFKKQASADYRSDASKSKNLSSAHKRQTVDQLDKLPKKCSRSMTQEHRKMLIDKRILLTQKCQDQILPIYEYLLGTNVITSFHKQTIESKSTAFEKVCTLLDILPERGDRAFDEFCKALTNFKITVENFNTGVDFEDTRKDTDITRYIVSTGSEMANRQKQDVTQQGSDSESIHANQQDEDDISQYFFDVAEHLEEDWINLKLKLDNAGKIEIKNIQDKYKKNYDQAYEFLEQWLIIYGENATKKRLIGALKAIQRKDIADKIK
ncbi:Death domain-containing protein CRADD [Trichoplax sp. H2]|nr:Death domain-containing protein CRADD [Trichoplax sp. H2]|eukprot:RDD45579.1 Death domain-containing protein CRADD [Trichoplax sp. H2]